MIENTKQPKDARIHLLKICISNAGKPFELMRNQNIPKQIQRYETLELILKYLENGRTLTEEQNKIVRHNLYRTKWRDQADLFKDKPASGKTAKTKKTVKKKAPAKKKAVKKVAKKKATKKKTANPIEGMKFVITGKLPSMGRAEATEIIKDNGGKVVTSISMNTDYLLSGEKTGTKLDKAKALGIKVITEQKFLKMLPQ